MALDDLSALFASYNIAPKHFYAALTPLALTALTILLRTLRYKALPTLDRSKTCTTNTITLGCVWIAPGGGDHGDGHRPDPGHQNALNLIKAAIAAGITHFDTAPWYGSGASETRLARALGEIRPSTPVSINTKAGRLIRHADGSPAVEPFDEPGQPPITSRVVVNDYTAGGAVTSLRQSLSRMGHVGGVDTLRIHDPNDNSNNRLGAPLGDEVAIALAPCGMIDGLRALRASGSVQRIGLGMNSNADAHLGAPSEVLRLLRGAPTGTFDSALLAGGWNLITQAGRACLAECELRGIEVHLAGVFASGVLIDPDSGTYAYAKAPAHIVDRARRWARLAERYRLPLPAVAIAFAVQPVCVKRLVLGVASASQLEQNLEWLRLSATVPAALWAEARAEGLFE